MEGMFDEKFYLNEYIVPDLLDEIESNGKPVSIYISIISLLADKKGKAQQIKQVVRFSKTGKTHMAEVHKIGRHHILYTKDISKNGDEHYHRSRQNVEKDEVDDFEEAFENKSQNFPTDETLFDTLNMSNTIVISPSKKSPKKSNDNNKNNKNNKDKKSKRNESSNSENESEKSERETKKSNVKNKKNNSSSPRNKKETKPSENLSLEEEEEVDQIEQSEKSESEREPIQNTNSNKNSNFTYLKNYKFKQNKKFTNIYSTTSYFVNMLIGMINKYRKENKCISGSVEINDYLQQCAQTLAEKGFLSPKEAKKVPLEFKDMVVEKSFSSQMNTISFSLLNIDPVDQFKDYFLSKDNKNSTILGNFTHIGLGVAFDGDKRWCFYLIFSCLAPKSIKNVKEISQREINYLMQQINNFRKVNGNKNPLKFSQRMTERSMQYVKKLFIKEFDTDSEEALDCVADIIHDYAFSDVMGSVNTTSNDQIKDVYNNIVENHRKEILGREDEIGLSIVNDGLGHWFFLIGLEHYESH